jgi:hypothetical protein
MIDELSLWKLDANCAKVEKKNIQGEDEREEVIKWGSEIFDEPCQLQ